MKPTTVFLIILTLCFSSCTSEYEESLKQGKVLRERLSEIEQNNLMLTTDYSNVEVKEIHEEIELLSKVSGNEELFMKEVFGN